MSASRREEQLRNAPATMTVVTDARIGNAPGPVVTDLMRAVPGVNVSQTSARDVNVTPRAATGTLSDSLLVLLDGRSIYQDFFGAVLWDFLPIAAGGDQTDRSDSQSCLGSLGRERDERCGQCHLEASP